MTPTPDSEPELCPRCGRPAPRDHVGGNCTACLLTAALEVDPTESASHPDEDETPKDLGDFEILGEIGRGGSGVVYRARHRGVNRIVALKTLHGAGLNRRENFQRLQIEAEAVGRLEHPNIVPLYELGRHAETHFLALRYFEHGSLADLLKRRRLGPEEAARLIRTAAQAIHHAHQHGVLHRDLKPSNLLLDEEGQPHVADFGLAKLADSDSSLTLSTSVLGTPAYMAPEQASGHAKEAGTPADIYALGAVLFELLTGRPPFTGTSALEILRQVADCDPPRPRSLNADVDADLEAICLHCLEKEPHRRYPTAAAVADDLERWLNKEPISLRPVTSGERLVRWARRRPLVAALAAGIVLALLIGLGTTTWQWRRAEARRVVLEQKDYRASLVLAADRLNEGDYPEARRILLDLPEKFRGWEWGRLTAMAHRELMEATVLTNDWLKDWRSDFNLCVSEDGRWIACWRLGQMEVVETATGNTVLALGSTNDWASHADSNPQGDLMAISGPGHGFSLWNTRTWKKVRDFGTNVPKASSIRFSRDGRLLLTTGATNRLDLWDAATGDHLRTVRDSGVALYFATFSTSGDRIIASRGGRGWIWDTRTGALLTEVPTTPSTPDFLEITSDARHFVTIETNGVAAAWRVGATRPFFQTPPEDGGIGWAGLNLSERRFATHRADSSQL
ncbi:MAG: protein kinase, partial [Verrucomicrobiales bacterium]|nr:protein kinase [Verrucomicrobiales bacterium]